MTQNAFANPQPPEEPDFPPLEELAPEAHQAQVVTEPEALPLPEAGGIAFTELYTPKGARINVTARAHNAKDAIRDLVEAVTWSMAEYGMTTERPGAAPVTTPAPPKPDPAAKAVAETGNAKLAAEVERQGEAVPPAPNGQAWLTMEIDRIVIKAEPGDAYTLEVYAPGHQWPDMKAAKRKAEVIGGLLKHITSDDPTKPADYRVNAIAYYLEGKTKTTGTGHWLDLYHLRLA